MSLATYSRRGVAAVFGVGLLFGLTGCDYWPPALQVQIEQLQAEVQTLTMEKNQLQAQVSDLSRSRQELQGQLDDLSRVTQEKSAIIAGLQNQLEAMRRKTMKTAAPNMAARKPSSKSTTSSAKPSGKTAVKTPGTKQAPMKPTGGR